MAYTETWNSTFEGLPAAGEDISGGAVRIQNLKNAIRERLEKDHYMDIAGTDADHGEHKWCTLREQSSKPTVAATKGAVYAKDVSGHSGLFFENDEALEMQLPFTSGTKMWFYQNAAPIGWTIDSTPADALLAVKGGTGKFNANGGTQAGSWTHLHATAAHTLTTAEMPAHTHSYTFTADYGTGSDCQYPAQAETLAHTDVRASTSTGGGGSHTHSDVAGAKEATGDTAGTWRPLAQLGIICTKD